MPKRVNKLLFVYPPDKEAFDQLTKREGRIGAVMFHIILNEALTKRNGEQEPATQRGATKPRTRREGRKEPLGCQ